MIIICKDCGCDVECKSIRKLSCDDCNLIRQRKKQQTPEAKEKAKVKRTPEAIAKAKRKTPRNKLMRKETQREYLQRPDVKAKRSEYDKKRSKTTHYKEYRKKFNQTPKRKAYRKKYAKEYNQKPEVKKKRKEYEQTPEFKENRKKYTKFKRDNDLNYYITKSIRNRFSDLFIKYLKRKKTKSILKYGINFEAIIEHLRPFPENRELYHIDHIKPLCSFNFINEDNSLNLQQIKKAFAPENHQWLLAFDNMSKGGRWEENSIINAV